MKVAIIGHKDFPSRSGGVEVMVGGLARSLVERGYDVTVYNRGLEKHHNVYDVDGVHARRVFTLQKPSLNATIYSFLATFDALFRGYDVIHYYEKRPCSLIRERYGLEQGEYILYVGRISPEKGTMDLVEGYRKAKTGKKLVLVGPLDDSEYCKTVQQQAQNDPNIIMTDYVVGDPLKELYSNCGLFVLPSHTEGLSLSLLEALSIGARCLVSDIPENTVVADIYGAAFTPEDTDDLARALERECAQEYPDAMRQQQIRYIHTNFEYEVMLDRYEEVYHHVVGDPLKAMPSTLKKKKVPAGAKA